ncbi:DUF1566 domain-containing protein [Tunturibacter empetritectus]|uniref:DUF1566 domain-containing protein n=1 Tax=Tunturiibacter empetritectus TaxID=3069691 RepID=A0AAU7Z8L7_9BACT
MKTLLTFLILNSSIVMTGQQTQEAQAHRYWVDPSTELMWAGKDVSYHKAMKYCNDLRLAEYSDWRLATMFELQPIFDRSAEAPGRAGDGKGGNPRNVTWHVKGNLFLTGNEWSSGRILDDRGKPSGYGYYFDFNEGKSNDDQLDYSSGKRALCVRISAKKAANH